MRIQDVMRGEPVVTIGPDATVGDLVLLLERHNIGAVVVSSDGSALEGIVSERDVVRRLATVGPAELVDASVRDLMTTSVRTCGAGDEVAHLMQEMTTYRIRHLPVVEDGARIVGIVSIGDVVKARIDELAFERDQLDAYVHQG
ncbi:CBS domain-containing protein [Nocardioides zeae]|uniref:CBS domain-containing protein n=1 Tax=Nocardioides zeae TaxID=1457234 RepID=A0A6P0HEA9_9ACTN|nr:CBS domain-containing protein [Nocardioides zeae]NEN76657.1 CBS domain-containing protein [Nocardioides zeae]